MLQDNPLLAQLKQQLHQQTPRVEGIIRAHDKGYGFLETENKKSYFVPANKMRRVLNGDKVSGQIITSNDKESFEPELIVEPALQEFIGQISFENKSMVIIPENFSQISMRCKVSNQVQHRLKEGDWVKAKLITHALEEGKNFFFAEVIQFIVEDQSPYRTWLITLARYNLESFAPNGDQFVLLDNPSNNRTDLTNVDFFTIDSKETLDMDDAISLTQDEQGNYHLMVAIADPSAYFDQTSETNTTALQRCFSTYLPSFTVPMLPKSLANELCSLKADEKRPALVSQIVISPEGDIDYNSTQFHLAWITSKAKLSYNDVSDFIENDQPIATATPELSTQLTLLASLAESRTNWRSKNALLFKDNNEYRFVFDENRQVINITKEFKRTAHKMVEEAMVIANQAFTQFIKTQLGFGVFNIHNGFDAKYIDSAIKLLNENNIEEFDDERLSTFEGYRDLRHALEKNDFLEYRLRRFQAPADFSIEPKPHFGMGFDAYATWTSPIRKYGDLLNHRLIKALLLKTDYTKPADSVLTVMNERRKSLRLAERYMSEKLYSQFLSDKIGQIYDAEIIDINRGGARVRLTEIGAVAFMPLSLIHPVRDEIASMPEEGIIKINQETRYQLLDSIRVAINQVKLESATVIVKLAD